MKIKVLIVFAVLFAEMCTASQAAAQRATRVNFKRGAHSAVVTGSLSSYKQSRTFLVRVRSGQTLRTEDAGGKPVSVWIEGPPGSVEQDLAADCHTTNEITPTTAGDYKLTVQECTKVDQWRGRFRVRITVR